MESFLMERKNIKVLNGPADLDTPVAGARVNMKNAKRVSFVVTMGTSTAAVASFALKQHNAAASGTSKALSIVNPYFYKTAANTAFTKVEPTVAADTFVLSTTFASAAGIVVFEVLEEDLDTNNGFAWVSLDIADTTAAKIGTVLGVIQTSDYPAYSLDV